MQNFRNLYAGLCLATALVVCPGCVEGNIFNLARYDAKTDTFTFAQIYSDIRTEKPEEADYLEALWKRRNSLLLNPIEFHIFSAYTFERQGSHSYIWVGLGTSNDSEPHAIQTDLDAIKVMPGQFFLNDKKNLGCYHQIAVPGSVIDTLFTELQSKMNDDAEKGIRDLIKKYDDPKNRRMTWDELRKRMSDLMLKKEIPKNDEKKPEGELLYPYDTESLQLMLKAAIEKSAKTTRNGDVFSSFVPLSKRDCLETIATFELFKTLLPQAIANPTFAPELLTPEQKKSLTVALLSALDQIVFRPVEGHGMESSVTPCKMITPLSILAMEFDAARKNEYDEQCKLLVPTIEGRGIKIDRQFSIKQLTNEYLAK